MTNSENKKVNYNNEGPTLLRTSILSQIYDGILKNWARKESSSSLKPYFTKGQLYEFYLSTEPYLNPCSW